MKNLLIYFTLVYLTLTVSNSIAQVNKNAATVLDGCATNQLHIANASLRQAQNNLDIQVTNYLLTHQTVSTKTMNAVVTIPTVVHIIHNNGAENISNAQVAAAIQQLNAMFVSSNGTQIQFCLAQRDPQNNATNGITRTQSALTTEVMENDDIALKDLNRWNPNQYLNIWVVQEILSASMGSGVVGYAYFPSAHGLNMDGIVMEANFFGVSAQTTAVLAHEVGHYLGLYHTFENGCTNNNCMNDGDKVCDTPPDQAVHASCAPATNSCHTDTDDASSNNPFTTDANDFGENYMDYSPLACYTQFTGGQYTRMNYFLNNARSSLLNSLGCNTPCSAPLTASITASGSTTIATGTTLNFTGTATNSAVYQYYINPSTILSTSTALTHTFATAGAYWVKFKAVSSNPAMCLNAIDSVKIIVMQPVAASCSGSIEMMGTNDAVRLPDVVQYHSANGFTWETWFNLSTPLTYPGRSLILSTDDVGYEDIFLGFGWVDVGFMDNDKLTFKIDGTNSGTGPNNVSCGYKPAGGFQQNTWYHAAGVMDYTNHIAKLYLNGVLVDTQINNSNPFTRNIHTQLGYDEVWINTMGGVYPNPTLQGKMDEVRIWNKPLSDTEIATYYNQCRAGTEPNLLVYYKANQTAGSTITDMTPNHLDGVLVNAAGWSNDAPSLVGAACTAACACSGTTTIPISTGIDNSQNALAIGASDPNWYLVNTATLDTITALTSTYYNGFWEPTPVAVTNAGWINISGSAYSGNTTGFFNYERKFMIGASQTLQCDFQMAWDDDLTALSLISPSNVVTNLPFVRNIYNLGFVTNTIINNPEAGIWTISATVNHIDQAAAFLLSGNMITTTGINAGNDTTICSGNVPLNASSGFDAYIWTPAAGLNNANIQNPIATPLTTTTYTVKGIKNTGNNLVYNGDFSLGNVGFTSDYTYSYPNNVGNYWIQEPNFTNLPDHSPTNDNLFMYVDGSLTPNQVFWRQTIPISTNTDYNFSFYQTRSGISPQQTQVKINGIVVGTFATLLPSAGVAIEYDLCPILWNSGTATSVTIELIDLQLLGYGNDFIIDDISLTQACIYTDSMTITVNNTTAPTLNLGANITNCSTATQVLDAGAGFNTYLWQDGSTAQTFTAYTAGTYTVTVTDACNNTQTDSIMITTTIPAVPTITATSTTITAGQCTTLAASTSTPAALQWNNATNSTTATITACPTATTTYTVNANYGNGCWASNSVTVNVVPYVETENLPNTDANIIIYPNPIEDYIHIKHPKTVRYIQLIDVLGRILNSSTVENQTETYINTTNLPKGVYFIVADDHEAVKVVK